MKKIKWGFWLGLLAIVFMAADALMAIWQPILPPGIFASIATILGIGSKVTTYLVDQDQKADLADDGVINGSNH